MIPSFVSHGWIPKSRERARAELAMPIERVRPASELQEAWTAEEEEASHNDYDELSSESSLEESEEKIASDDTSLPKCPVLDASTFSPSHSEYIRVILLADSTV